MITVEDFKKLVDLQSQGCTIYCDNVPVSLFYDWDDDYLELAVDDPQKYACTFTFQTDRYNTVFTLLDDSYANEEWTVKRIVDVDWRSQHEPHAD